MLGETPASQSGERWLLQEYFRFQLQPLLKASEETLTAGLVLAVTYSPRLSRKLGIVFSIEAPSRTRFQNDLE
ncbi:MAG: hypothetical protein AUF79_15900 [Crenarchaeota archaeon 13_1_20CM_2_51_8]|nr:MAG: hypothetical protein AUF79_15900 [Crenarchaeota archaeon 13_1_20CM_2_51_8]